jgi:urease accessory protein
MTEIGAPIAVPNDTARVGRDGLLRLGFERVADRSALTRCRWTMPLQVLAPVALDDRAAVVSVVNPTGGLLGGDRLTIDVDASSTTHACVTTPSATRVYRTAGEPALQDVRLRIAPDACVEWVPDHTIPFPDSSFRQRIDADVDERAVLVLIDAFAAGRIARGEAWRFRSLESALTIRDAQGLIFVDRFALAAPTAEQWSALGFAEGRPYFGSFVVIADTGIDRFVAAAREIGAQSGGIALGAAQLRRRGAVVRYLAGDAPGLTALLDALWAAARRTVLGLPPLALRKA